MVVTVWLVLGSAGWQEGCGPGPGMGSGIDSLPRRKGGRDEKEQGEDSERALSSSSRPAAGVSEVVRVNGALAAPTNKR